MATCYLRVVVTLLGVVAAQQVCKDDTNFLADNPISVNGLGEIGTCGGMRDMLFGIAPASLDACLAETRVRFNGVDGAAFMPAIDVQSFLARTKDSNGAGCCGNSTEGSSCLQFLDKIPTAPCQEGHTRDYLLDVCLPCHGTFKDGDCLQCWGVDTSGCDQDKCAKYGKWDDANGCLTCNSMDGRGCDEPTCRDMGGNWMQDSCHFCRPESGSVYACTEQQCENSGDNWVDGYCARCAPEDGNSQGCTEQQCQEKMAVFPNLNWVCMSYGYCECGMCPLQSDPSYGYNLCREDQCVPTAGAMDVNWTKTTLSNYNETTQSYYEQDHWECMRCFNDGSASDSQGCLDKASCEAVDDFVWSGSYCTVCTNMQYWQCPDEKTCSAAGQHWCLHDASNPDWGGSCTNPEYDSCASQPQCKSTSVSAAMAAKVKEMGYEIRKC